MTYLVSINPSLNEQGTYNRFATNVQHVVRQWTWTWGFDVAVPAGTQMRLLVDGVARPWQAVVGNQASFAMNETDGHHVCFAEASIAGVKTFAVDFVVNATAAVLQTQAPWVAQRRVPGEYGLPQLQPKQITGIPYSQRPYTAKMKARTVAPYTNRRTAAFNGSTSPMAGLWIRRWGENSRDCFFRRFWKTPKGDLVIVGQSKYARELSISNGTHPAGTETPTTILRDGPRGWGTLGTISKALLRSNGKGVYTFDTQGRVAHMQFASSAPTPPGGVSGVVPGESFINTFVGWRVNDFPEWEPENGGVSSAGSEHGWEHIGNWSRVSGAHRTHEMWGGAVAIRRTDGTIDNRDGLDFWLFDTKNDRVLYMDAWALHPDVSQFTGRPSTPHFPPAGYTFPGHVAEAQIVPFLPAIPKPWDGEVCPLDEKLYGTAFEGDYIFRVSLDGSGFQVVTGRATPLTPAQLGLTANSKWLDPSSLPLATLRQLIVDGAPGTATVNRPMSCQFDAAGDLWFVERYTYALRKLIRATGHVVTMALLPVTSLSGGSADTNEFGMAIDVNGDVGPAGDVFVSGWAGSAHWRYDKNGVLLGNIYGVAQRYLKNGPGDLADPPNYTWAITVGPPGRIMAFGNAAGSQVWEATAKLASDPVVNFATYDRGAAIWRQYFLLTHGHDGYGELGHPNIEAMGSWTDAQISIYANVWAVPSGSFPVTLFNGTTAQATIADLIYYVRFMTCDFDYTAQPAPDAPTLPLTLVSVT